MVMSNIFLATICNKRGAEKRKFLVKAQNTDDANNKLSDLNTKESKDDEPLFYAEDSIYIEQIEFKDDICEI